MFVLTGAIDKGWLTVEIESGIVIMAQYGPRYASYAERCAHLIGSLALPLDHRYQGVEIRICQTPSMCICHSLSTGYHAGLAGLQSQGIALSEKLLATG